MTAPLTNKSPLVHSSRSIPIPNLKSSSESSTLNVIKQIIKWRREKYIPDEELRFEWNDLHISIVGDYLSSLSTTCDFRELPSADLLRHDCFCNAKTVSSVTQELRELFVVPRLNEFHESQNHQIKERKNRKQTTVLRDLMLNEIQEGINHHIKKTHLVEGFISFILRLLYHKTYSMVKSCKDGIDKLEKELRFLLTILGHTSLRMLGNEHEQFQKFLAAFEAVANKAGGVVHSLFFSTNRPLDEGIDAVLNQIGILKGQVWDFSGPTHIIPNSCVVDSVLIVDSLIDDLEDMMNRKDNRISDVKNHIKTLHQGLIYLQSLTKGIGCQQPSQIGELKGHVMRTGHLAHEAEFLIISFLVGDAPLWYSISSLLDINHEIETIGAKVQQYLAKKYEFGGLKAAKNISLQAPQVNDVTVGWEDKAIPILHHLVGGTERLQVISIFGMPGLGKTTLANKLYNHPLINDRFDKKSWSAISQNYRRKSMLTEILININRELEKDRILHMEEETLVDHIHKTLKGRRFLIVTDDIWELNAWDDLQRCFPDDANGSRILLTTRNKDVAPPSGMIYQLPFLSNDQCWELLEKKVFGNRHCPSKLQKIGKDIAANCHGLPLAVVVIAGILSTLDEKESTWAEVRGDLASYILDGGDNSVMRILELSYKHLPDYLKPCFLYLAAFEEDKEIPTGNLMRLWNAEGFIRRKKEKSAENIGAEYLKELIDKSLVMVAKRRSDGGVKTCVIHDLLRDFCLKRSKEENFLKFFKGEYQTTYEKGYRIRALGDSMTLSFSQHVRSYYGSNQTSPFYVRDMRLLRVLRFDYIHHNDLIHFIGIEYLVNLRYLVITDLPESIDSLVNLEYLRTETSVAIYLPPTIANLMKLRYLHVLFPKYDKGWSNSHTNNLEFLSWASISELNDEERLKLSPYLRKLKCRYELRSLEKTAYPSFDLCFLTQLESLNLTLHCYSYFVTPEFRFPPNIRKLTLSNSRMHWGKMSTIGRLENLEVLKLRGRAFEGERWDTRDGEFQKLRFLQLDEVPLTQWNVGSSHHFPRLQSLVLEYCYKLQDIPSEIGEIETLQLIEVQGRCQKSIVESAKRIQQEQLEIGNEEFRVIINITDYATSSSIQQFNETFTIEL